MITQVGIFFLPEFTEPTLGLKEGKSRVVGNVEQNIQFCFLESRNLVSKASLWFVFIRVQVSKDLFMKSISSFSSKSDYKLQV